MRRRSTGEAKISSKSGVTPALLRSVVEGLESLCASAQGERTDLRPPLALLAGRNLELDEDELHGARRRALLLLAAGGDPERGLVLDGRAVVALADELMTSGRLAALTRGLESLREPAEGFPHAAGALRELLADPGLAWRAFACALLAEELSGN